MSTWVHYDTTTGQIVAIGVAPNDREAEMQPVEDGRAALILPDGLIVDPYAETPDFSRLKTYLRSKVDMEADAIFKSYVTDITGQDRRYLLKAQEALAWTEGDEIAHPEKYPFMIAEATIRSAVSGSAVSIATVRDEIMDQIAESSGPEAIVEAYRVAHKLQISNATTIAELALAAAVDWDTLLASELP